MYDTPTRPVNTSLEWRGALGVRYLTDLQYHEPQSFCKGEIMMRMRAKVLDVTGGDTLVEIVNPGSSCGSCKGCFSITGERKSSDTTLQVDNFINARSGDLVVVENRTADLTKAAVIMYGVPTLGLFVGYLGSYQLWKTDSIAAIGAVGGLVLAALLAKPLVNKLSRLMVNRPRIVALAVSDGKIGQSTQQSCH